MAVVYLRTYETEERDRVSLKLPQNGDRLVQAVSPVNPNTVVIVGSRRARDDAMARPRADAVMQSWFGGQEEGNALTSVLFGDESPPATCRSRSRAASGATGPGQDNPWDAVGNLDVDFAEGVNIGYRGYLARNIEPAFPFGHGLSYTTFRYDRLVTRPLARGADSRARAAAGREHRRQRTARRSCRSTPGRCRSTDPPERKLVGFAKVDLDAGERAPVRIDVDREQLSYWDESRERWVTPTGDVPIYVGASATDTRLAGSLLVR